MLQLFKQCSICLQEKPSTEFNSARSTKDKLSSYCKSCKSDYSNKRYKENPEILEKIKAWQKENKEKVQEATKKYASNPINRIKNNLKKTLSARKIVGESPIGLDDNNLKFYLEGQFTPEMNWDNYGTVWAIYRFKTPAEFDLTKPEEVAQINHFTNLQPRIIAEEIEKMKKPAPTQPADLVV
jgi:hypothetical protein